MSRMRSLAMPIAGLMMLATSAAQAAVSITVDKNTQQMIVAVDGVTRYNWPVSSGNPSHETPNGSFRTFRMEEDHYSKEFDDAPMPHAIFFTKQGHAIHGTDSVNRLGSPASHGCVRLSRANAQTLWDIVKAEGVLNTTVTLTGSSQVALARNPRLRTNVAATRNAAPQYDAYGQPLQTAPRQPTEPQYDENAYVSPPVRAPRPNREYVAPSYQQDQTYYGYADQRRLPAQQQHRIYVDPQTGQRYYVQERAYSQDYEDQASAYDRQRYYYGPRGAY